MEQKRLADAEFQVMKAIWNMVPPVTSTQLAEYLPQDKNWKPQTVLTLLTRMEKKGFVSSEKTGKERFYRPLVTEQEYMDYEMQQLRARYDRSPLTAFVSSLYQGDQAKKEELDELERWLEEQDDV